MTLRSVFLSIVLLSYEGINDDADMLPRHAKLSSKMMHSQLLTVDIYVDVVCFGHMSKAVNIHACVQNIRPSVSGFVAPRRMEMCRAPLQP